MARKRTAILRWTGRGDLADLRSSVEFELKQNDTRARIRSLGNSLLVEGPEPTAVVALLEHMPGIEWIAAGETVGSFRDLVVVSGAIGRKYLRRGDLFRVKAEGTAGAVAADVSGAATSGILEGVKGARPSEERAKVTFRAAFDGSRGAVGIEAAKGPGGVPTGRRTATCLVSGGKHSSVVAWMALLMGFRVALVHAKLDDGGLRAVAKLYSELSHRADPRGLSLEVLEGGSVRESIEKFADKLEGPVFGGFHGEGGEVPARLRGIVQAPLFLLPVERFDAEFESLGIKAHDSRADWNAKGSGTYMVRKFGGVVADINGVLDGL